MATINKKYGETYIATATPNTGYRFVRWTGTGVSTTDNPATLTCAGDNTIEAIFERLQYTLNVGVYPATSGTIVFDPQPASENVIRYTSATAATSDWISENTDTTKNTYNSSTGQGVLYVKPGVYALGSPADTVAEEGIQAFGDTPITSLDLTDFTYEPNTRAIKDPFIGPGAFSGNTSLTTVTIGRNIKWIGAYAFNDCTNLQRVVIQGVTSIGAYAFNRCFSLSTLNITGTVSTIGQNAFADCGALTSVAFPVGLKYISDGAFESCYSLTSVTLPEGLEYIASVVFPSSLSSLTVPSTVGFIQTFAPTTIFKSYAPPIITDGSLDYIDIQVPSNAVSVWRSYTFNYGLTGDNFFKSITSNGTAATVTNVPVYFRTTLDNTFAATNLYPYGWNMDCEHKEWSEATYNSIANGGVTMSYAESEETSHQMDSVRASTNKYFNNYLTISPSALYLEDVGEGPVVTWELYAAGDYTTVRPGSVVYYMAFKNGYISTMAQYVPTENDLACWRASNPYDTSECPEE